VLSSMTVSAGDVWETTRAPTGAVEQKGDAVPCGSLVRPPGTFWSGPPVARSGNLVPASRGLRLNLGECAVASAADECLYWFLGKRSSGAQVHAGPCRPGDWQ